MRKIEDRELVEMWIQRENIRDYFDTPGLVFQGYRYEKGEFLSAPDIPYEKLLFLVEGSFQIYGIRDDGIMRCDSDSGKKLIKSMVLRTADRQGMC